MATLTNPLNVKKGSTVYACTCYTTTDEATPKTITGGSCWKIKNNNTECYVGLWPTSVSGGSYHTPLKLKKSNVEYYVETKVVNTYTVTITQSSNQTIKVTCNGSTYTSTFTAPAGAAYTVTVTPATGYTAGAPSSASGYVNSNITITASAASKAKYTVTITQSANQTIKVTCGGTTYTSTFTAEYGATWTATVTANTGYTAGKLNKTSGTITGATTISATAATAKTCVLKFLEPDSSYGTAYYVWNYGSSYDYPNITKVSTAASYSITYGSTIYVVGIAQDGYGATNKFGYTMNGTYVDVMAATGGYPRIAVTVTSDITFELVVTFLGK